MTTGLRYANADCRSIFCRCAGKKIRCDSDKETSPFDHSITAAAADDNVSGTLDNFSGSLDNFSGTFDESGRRDFESRCSPEIGQVSAEEKIVDEPAAMILELGSSLDQFDLFS